MASTVAFGPGMVKVSVEERRPGGERVNLVVPAALLPLGLKCVPDEHLRTASAELRPWLPAIEAATRELARVPDGPLVEVESLGERVSIVKRGGRLVIDVESDEESVHVSVPLKILAAVARELAAADSTH